MNPKVVGAVVGGTLGLLVGHLLSDAGPIASLGLAMSGAWFGSALFDLFFGNPADD